MGFFSFIGETIRLIFLLLVDPLRRLSRCCFQKTKKSIKGEIVLITGAGQGLGRELAQQLSGYGSTLVLWDINEDNVKAVATQLRMKGHLAHAYKVDVTNRDEVITAANQVKQEVGDVTIVVNNAGVFSGHSLPDLTEQRIRLTFEVNVVGHFWVLQQFLPKMLEKNKGHVVSIASMAGHLGTAYMTDYCSSKFGAVGLMESLYHEIKAEKKNIKLTTVNPIIIQTGLISNTKTRFPGLLPLMDIDATAKLIVNGILREKAEIYVPGRMQCFLCFINVFSRSTRAEIYEYINYGFTPDKLVCNIKPVIETV